ncbi:hypothetical protein HMPREF0239_03310 [Clostridium sp. ATCC BAA-442]|nr:hypothetical protein HMPREF0239_03310 [Clostridium sp. ATCC BAA-442]
MCNIAKRGGEILAECSIKKRGQNTDIVSFHNLIVKYLSFGIRV